jgi:hypothetical protein
MYPPERQYTPYKEIMSWDGARWPEQRSPPPPPPPAAADAYNEPLPEPAPIKCRCGHKTKVFLVKKEGSQYKGKYLHVCPDETSAGCKLWYIDGSEAPSKGKATVQCYCKQACAQREVKKAGPNTGKVFHTCHTGGCKFFEWEK